MSKEKKYVLYAIGCILLLVIGVTLAYFAPKITGDSKTVSIKSKGLYLKYTGTLRLNGNIEPGWSKSISFKVNSTSNKSENYDIYIKDLINTFVTSGYLQYKITSTDGGYNMTDYEDIPKSSTKSETVLANYISINSGETHSYTVSFIYKESDEDQSSDMGKTLSGTLMIKEGTKVDLEGTQVALDNALQNQIPSFSTYNGKVKAVVKCTSGNAEFNYNKWRLEAEIGSNCSLSFQDKSLTKTYLNNYIISLNNKEVGDGIVTNENGYRYEGSNPNNYILYNGELWRIIGVFDSTTHGVNGNLVKIIKNDSIGGLVYSTATGINSWGVSTLYKLLNQETGGSYYTGVDYTNKASGTYCSSYYGYTPSDCSFSKTGIRSEYARGMIEKTKWYSTAFTSIGTAPDTYSKDVTTTTSTEGYVGLMYASDYGYAVKESDCARTISLRSYKGSTNGLTCAGKNWLKSGRVEWTLSRSSTSSSWYVYDDGFVDNYGSVAAGNAVRPTLYLKSSVYYVSGSGMYDDPIIIGN